MNAPYRFDHTPLKPPTPLRTTTLRQQDQTARLLHNPQTHHAASLSAETAHLVSALGRPDAGRLVAFAAAALRGRDFHRAVAHDSLRVAADASVRLLSLALTARRNPSTAAAWTARLREEESRGLTEPQRRFNATVAQVCWDVEARVWARNLVCLHGCSAEERDGLYVAAVKVLERVILLEAEVREARGSAFTDDDLVRLFATLDDSPFGKGCVPWRQRVLAARGILEGQPDRRHAICYPGCTCRVRMLETELLVEDRLVAPELELEVVSCRCCPFGIHREAGITVLEPAESEEGGLAEGH